jgi:transcriptional regulator
VYVPPQFAEADFAVLRAAMEQFPLATLVTGESDGLLAAHVPMLLDPEPAPLGTLLCHVARANAIWRAADGRSDALAIFSGPDAYISPQWYDDGCAKASVPTWNYVAVHAHGPLRPFHDPARLHRLVERLTAAHEVRFAQEWRVDDAPREYIANMLGAIVGLEMPVQHLIGKWKMSQNRSAADRTGVEDALLASDTPRDRETGAVMRAQRSAKNEPS